MKKLKKLTIILTIVLLSLVSFIGIYVKKQNIMTNIVKDYDFGMNIEGYRELRITAVKDEDVTSEKVEQVKRLLQTRLEKLGARDYLIKVNYVTGEIVLELEENDSTDKIVSDVYTVGNLKMVDSEDTTKVLMTREHIEEASVLYNSTEKGTAVYLDLKFTKEGSKIIEDLSTNAYKTVEKEETKAEETTEKTEDKKEEVKQPKLTLMIDGTELTSSSFDFPITTGRLQLTLGVETTDTEKLQESVRSGVAIATILNEGPLPIKYEISGNTYIYSEITEQDKNIFVIAISAIVVIALILLVIKYKMSAVLAGISYIGFIAIYLLVLKYTNVVITLEGIAGILVMLIINYLAIQKMLSNLSIKDAFKEMVIQLIPIIAVIVTFSFVGWTNIASFGMTMFWGVILTIIYNLVVTRALLKK